LPVLVMTFSKPMSNFNRFHARTAKITILRGVPHFGAFVPGEPPHLGA
jgi:hypothetical protein